MKKYCEIGSVNMSLEGNNPKKRKRVEEIIHGEKDSTKRLTRSQSAPIIVWSTIIEPDENGKLKVGSNFFSV